MVQCLARVSEGLRLLKGSIIVVILVFLVPGNTTRLRNPRLWRRQLTLEPTFTWIKFKLATYCWSRGLVWKVTATTASYVAVN